MANVLLLLAAVEASIWLKSTAPIAVYVIGSLVFVAWQGRDGRSLSWYRQIRPMIVLQDIGVLAAVAVTAVALLSLDNPVLNFGWYTLVSAAVGQGDSSANILTVPMTNRLLVVPFLLLLLYVLPRLAETEELIFRRGTKTWRHGIARSLIFGLAHMSVGIPLAAALALSIGGLWFTHQYFVGGVARSTVYHLTYNLIVVVLVVVATIAGAS